MRPYTGPHPDRWKYPYIGVTGFMTPDEVRQIVHLLADRHENQDGTLKPERRLMVGVLVSDTTMNGQRNKRPNRYPAARNIKTIFHAASEAGDIMTFRVAHYNTHDPATLDDQLLRLYELAGGYIMSGVQLNVAWPYLDCLEKYRANVPDTHRIILQIGHKAMEGLEPKEIGQKVVSYGPIITDVLVDPSGGLGKRPHPSTYFKILDAIRVATEGKIGLGYAGGLAADSHEPLEDLYLRYPDLSIDAEGRLRDRNDNLNVSEAFNYVQVAIASIRKSRLPKKG